MLTIDNSNTLKIRKMEQKICKDKQKSLKKKSNHFNFGSVKTGPFFMQPM